MLRCGHPCLGLCGELCPNLCRICNNDKYKQILSDETEGKKVSVEKDTNETINSKENEQVLGKEIDDKILITEDKDEVLGDQNNYEALGSTDSENENDNGILKNEGKDENEVEVTSNNDILKEEEMKENLDNKNKEEIFADNKETPVDGSDNVTLSDEKHDSGITSNDNANEKAFTGKEDQETFGDQTCAEAFDGLINKDILEDTQSKDMLHGKAEAKETLSDKEDKEILGDDHDNGILKDEDSKTLVDEEEKESLKVFSNELERENFDNLEGKNSLSLEESKEVGEKSKSEIDPEPHRYF